jgi:CoA:oxalate CoA-transferase
MNNAHPNPTSNYPLAGINVLDLGQIYQGPYCGFLLAMGGARVIKIEPPDGEPIRFRADSQGGTSVPQAILNSNKLGITLNLKSEHGCKLFLDLVEKADVVLENFAPGVMDKLGVGAKVLTERNPRLIYASGTGYGSSGPYRDYLAMDLTIQAMSGMMSVTGFENGPPVKAGPAVCDFLGGTHLYAAVITALLRRERTGKGAIVETAMLDAAYPTLASNLGLMYDLKAPPPRTGNSHGGKTMGPYSVYPTKDGFVAVICVKDEHWRSLARAMGRPELADDPHYATHATRTPHMDEIDGLISNWTIHLTKNEVFDIARRDRFPAAPVRDLCEVTDDPHLHQRGMLTRMQHPELGEVVLPNTPLRFADLEPIPLQFNPSLGEHTVKVMREMLNLTDPQIEDYRLKGAF